ncbi:MAG: bifunctional adenosylcobinamide kinase/adenosylcobinamide-phosphate guanylyltransferase [Actinomycetota bacterium]
MQPKTNFDISLPLGLIVLLGGARSGKSSLAVELATQSNKSVIFIATAQAHDEDMKNRIARHRSERPNWQTIEEPINLNAALNNCATNALVIIDCLTLWISNLMLGGYSETEIRTANTLVLSAIDRRVGTTIAISNEVGLGIVPETPIGRDYRDGLGRINQQWVRASSKSLFLVAGRALELQKPERLLR